MDTIRDMLSVGQFRHGLWYVAFWEDEAVSTPRVVGTFPREDEAWGVTQLILEYVEKLQYDPQAAIWAALDEYHRALDNEPIPDVYGYLDAQAEQARVLELEPEWSRLGYVG